MQGGAAGQRPLRVPVLSIGRISFWKHRCQKLALPPTRLAHPTGNTGFATCCAPKLLSHYVNDISFGRHSNALRDAVFI